MRLQIFAVFLILSLSFSAPAQELTANTDTEQIEAQESRKIDEFGLTGDCDLGARLDYLLIQLSENPGSVGYVIIYRGADALSAAQTEGYLQRQIRRVRSHFSFRRFDESRLVIIDGGFRPTDSVLNEIWLVPPGAVSPQPTGTVEKSRMPTDKAYKVDEGFFENYAALINKEEESVEETVQITEDVPETVEETTETSETENSDEQTEEVDEELSDETPPFYWFSGYFGQTLNEEKEARGVIFFYTDAEEYDLAQSRRIVEEGLQNLAEESEFDPSRVKIIFGGYREQPRVEYWIVPKGAQDPQLTPEVKIVKESEEN